MSHKCVQTMRTKYRLICYKKVLMLTIIVRPLSETKEPVLSICYNTRRNGYVYCTKHNSFDQHIKSYNCCERNWKYSWNPVLIAFNTAIAQEFNSLFTKTLSKIKYPVWVWSRARPMLFCTLACCLGSQVLCVRQLRSYISLCVREWVGRALGYGKGFRASHCIG